VSSRHRVADRGTTTVTNGMEKLFPESGQKLVIVRVRVNNWMLEVLTDLGEATV